MAGASLIARDAAGQTARYRLTPLVNLNFIPVADPPFTNHGTMGINNKGQVVYTFFTHDEHRAWVWLPEAEYGLSAGFTDLTTETKGDTPAIARDINENGIVVGVVGDFGINQGKAHAWMLGDPIDEDEIEDDSEAYAVNDADPPIIVGWRLDDETCLQVITKQPGLMWELGGAVDDLPLGASHVHAIGFDIGNDADQTVAGQAAPCSRGIPECTTEDVGAAWIELATEHLLGDGGIYGEDDPFTYGRGVDDNGRISGYIRYQPVEINCRYTATFWESYDDTAPVDLGEHMPSGESGDQSKAMALNGATDVQVVGWNESDTRATMWERISGTWTGWNLNSSASIPTCSSNIWTLHQAHDINDEGWIICWGSRLVEVEPEVFEPQHWSVLLSPLGECPYDINHDNEIDGDDLAIIQFSGGCQPGAICWEDVNNDCTPNSTDYNLVAMCILIGGCCGSSLQGGGDPPTEGQLQLWLDSGGWDALRSNEISSAQVYEALQLGNAEDVLSALFELLTQ